MEMQFGCSNIVFTASGQSFTPLFPIPVNEIRVAGLKAVSQIESVAYEYEPVHTLLL